MASYLTGQRAEFHHAAKQPRVKAHWTAVVIAATILQPSSLLAADQKDVAISALEFGGSVGKLLWVSANAHSNATGSEANQYQKLANEIKAQIELGRASSSLVK